MKHPELKPDAVRQVRKQFVSGAHAIKSPRISIPTTSHWAPSLWPTVGISVGGDLVVLFEAGSVEVPRIFRRGAREELFPLDLIRKR